MSANGTSDNALLETLIEEVVEKRGFTSFRMECRAGTIKGDNYLGNINKAKVICKNGKILNLVIKLALQGEQIRKQIPIREVYLREIFMYETVFPAFKHFKRENCVPKPLSFLPKCYSTSQKCGTEALILEDLSELGYKMWNRRKPMDENHVTLTLKTFGQFHALSMAMRDQKPDMFDELAANLNNVMENFYGDEAFLPVLQTHLDKAIDSLDEDKHEIVISALKKFRGEALQFVRDIGNLKEHCVVIHGDCWCNNFMFKYEVSAIS